MLTILVLPIIVLGSVSASSEKCYNPKQDFYPYMGTKTSYQFVRGNITRPESSCAPVQIWMVARYGTSYPAKEVLSNLLSLVTIRDEIVKNHEMAAGFICPKDLENLKKWQPDPNLNDNVAQSLTSQGKEEMRLLAKRLQSAFPELLQTDPTITKPRDYTFRATDTQRTQNSMKSFLRGLFGNTKGILPEKSHGNDTLLRLHENCPVWNISYQNDLTERDKFTEGLEIHDTLQKLSKRLGFNQTIAFNTVKSMYDMCRFETAWYPNRTSTWCTLFNKEDMKVLEYREDLDQYYSAGSGNELSAKLGCQTLTDMFQHFKKLESGDFMSQPKGIFYFAHTVTVQSLMALLKIGKESPSISSVNYATADKRKYRASLLTPFATNVIAVFYKCNGVKSPNKVTFYVAERLVPFAGCKDGLCNWEFLKREFGPNIDQCSTDFCYDLPKNELAEEAMLTAADSGVKMNVAHPLVLMVSLILSRLWVRSDWLT